MSHFLYRRLTTSPDGWILVVVAVENDDRGLASIAAKPSVIGAKFVEFAPSGPPPSLPRYDSLPQCINRSVQVEVLNGTRQGLTIRAAIQILGNGGTNW